MEIGRIGEQLADSFDVECIKVPGDIDRRSRRLVAIAIELYKQMETERGYNSKKFTSAVL